MIYEFEGKLKQIIASCDVAVDLNKLNEDTDLTRDFGFNSIDLIQLVVNIESEFDIEIDENDLMIDKLSPYKELVQIIKKKIK